MISTLKQIIRSTIASTGPVIYENTEIQSANQQHTHHTLLSCSIISETDTPSTSRVFCFEEAPLRILTCVFGTPKNFAATLQHSALA